ncbi:hypothetical protein IHE45_03G068700 [Dioscorea alata]|uniref:Uncharacterized protein n=1 Tax=Dioscorea alata TaxID=55571 RepID=A0ACB7WM37_DIOAL|nr:hypothetical protein IHE45_03G068700 [Dioscorea alata]
MASDMEKQYAEEVTMKANEQSSSDRLREASIATPVSKDEVKETKSEPKGSSSKTEQDLDVFLLGDLGSEDDDPDGGDDGFDDDFDKNGKMVSNQCFDNNLISVKFIIAEFRQLKEIWHISYC